MFDRNITWEMCITVVFLFCSVQALEELKNFMIIKGVATKERQKLMRNLRVSTVI